MPDCPNRLHNCRGLLRFSQRKLDEQAERSFQQARWREGSLVFHQRDVASFDPQTFSQFRPGELCFLSEQRNGFSKFQEMTRCGIVRIARHVALMKFFEIVVHRYPCR